MKIAKTIENENLDNPEGVERLKMEIHHCLQPSPNHAAGQLFPDLLDRFFRNLRVEGV